MAYIIASDETKTLRTYYVPIEINIITPPGVPYNQFTIQFKIQRIRADMDTGDIVYREDAGTIIKALSEITPATVLAVETEIALVMQSVYGGAAQMGPMEKPAPILPDPTPSLDGN